MSSVELLRDVDGIAHVRARTPEDAAFGQGFASAEDRLWQMEYDRRRAAGTLAEIVGPPAVPSDRFHRRLGLAAASRSDFESLTAETRRFFEAYAAGVNERLSRLHGDELPPELAVLGATPAPWEAWESVAVFKVRHLLMGTYEVKLWRSALIRNLGVEAAGRLWPSEEELTVVPGEALRLARELASDVAKVADALAEIPEETAASNNLAVHGSRTASGMPIVAGDPHRALDLPNVYWQNHLTCDAFDVIGLSFPGVPGFPHFGHNTTVAWCITHGMADDQDIYLERLRDDGRGGVDYQDVDGWKSATTREQTIAVAGESQPLVITAIETSRGPVVAGDPDLGVGLALRWTALTEPDTTFDTLLPMLSASTVGELDDCMRGWVAPGNNLVSADREGDIAYRFRGRLAVRPPANGWTIVPGWTGAHEWDRSASYDDQTHVVNPQQGFLVTANNRPSADGPYVGNDFAHPARSKRINQLLAEQGEWSVDSIVGVLGDTKSLVAPRFVEGLLAVPAGHAVERAAQQALREWDGQMDVEAAGATIYAACRAELLRVVSASLGLSRDRLGAVAVSATLQQSARFLWTRLAFLAGATDRPLTELDGGWPAAYASALRWGVRALEARFGADVSRWRWGSLHTVRWQHPLVVLRPDLAEVLAVPAQVEVGGDGECVRATGVGAPELDAVSGPVARYVFDLADWEQSCWIVPHGVSGDARSPHWSDQLERWAAVEMLPMRYSAEVVDAATVSTVTLER